MSQKTLPLIFLNMGGEMVYILDQRLSAQNVKPSKAARVLGDIVSTMFSRKFLDELFKPQDLYSRKAMRTLYDKLAHSSIMRLNTNSMDKLYDLMTMAIKYQLLNTASPQDVLLITLNHLDGVRKLIQGAAASIQAQIDYAYSLISEHYFELTHAELAILRSSLLAFFQDARIKVSLLLREKKQREDGRFIIPTKGVKLAYGASAPGTIRYFGEDGKLDHVETFPPGGTFVETSKMPNLSKNCRPGERVTSLGVNVYKNTGVDIQGGAGSAALSHSQRGMRTEKENSAASELQLLSRLISSASAAPDFTLNLFESRDEEVNFVREAELAVQSEAAPTGQVLRIDARRDPHSAPLAGFLSDLSLASSANPNKRSRGDDLLHLMDSTH